MIVLYSPESFIAVGQFYRDFGEVSDYTVKKIMKRQIQGKRIIEPTYNLFIQVDTNLTFHSFIIIKL